MQNEESKILKEIRDELKDIAKALKSISECQKAGIHNNFNSAKLSEEQQNDVLGYHRSFES